MGLWTSIREGWDSFSRNVTFGMGMGMALEFCFGMTNGVDCGDSCLKYLFPDLFTLALDKNVSMASYLVGIGNRVRQVQDWETELVENRLPSTLRKNGKCDVKSYD